MLQNPTQVLQPAVYGKVMADMGLVLEEFAAIKTPVEATGPWVAARQQRDHQHDGNCGSTDVMDVDESGATEGAAEPEEGGAGGGVGTRYLTSSKLFGLQVRDCTFRCGAAWVT